MAMNKKERLEFEQMKKELELLRTSLKSGLKMPERLPIPDSYEKIVNGWDFNLYGLQVYKACTSSIYHATRQWDKTTSQQAKAVFATELDAWIALRITCEEKFQTDFRRDLKEIDTQIKKLGGK